MFFFLLRRGIEENRIDFMNSRQVLDRIILNPICYKFNRNIKSGLNRLPPKLFMITLYMTPCSFDFQYIFNRFYNSFMLVIF